LILVIGASGNLGSEILRELSEDNKKTISLGRKEPLGVVNNIHVNVDILDLETFSNILDEVFSTHNIEGVIYNSGYTVNCRSLAELKSQDIEDMLTINFKGYLALLQKIELLYESLDQMRVVYISSNSLVTLNASNTLYIATKSASEAISLSTTKRLGKKIIINIIRPGLMQSSMTEERFTKVRDDIIKKTPSEKLVLPSQVARTIMDILKSDVLIGQIVSVDGGRTI